MARFRAKVFVEIPALPSAAPASPLMRVERVSLLLLLSAMSRSLSSPAGYIRHYYGHLKRSHRFKGKAVENVVEVGTMTFER